VAFVGWLSLAEWKALERLFATDPTSTPFVVESVRGVMAGTPISRSWQHRLLGPLLVTALGGADAEALARSALLLLAAANLLLFALLARRGASLVEAVRAVIVYGALRLVLAYKLEYPWDGIDQLLFLAFGAWVARGGSLRRWWPLLLVGLVNHETILYVPLWYLLRRNRRQIVEALVAAAVLGGGALALRQTFYRGAPALPGQVFEQPLPAIDNHFHVAHNLRQLFLYDWTEGRAHLAAGFFGAVGAFSWMCTRAELRRPGAWSLAVIATVMCFGYVNETRHYLVLLAFWMAYAGTGAGSAASDP
jgi:hypothetical protein